MSFITADADTLFLFNMDSPKTALADGDTLNLATAWTTTAEGDPGALIRYDHILITWPHGVTPLF